MFSILKPRNLPRPSIRGSEEYQQPDGDDHWPVTVTSQKRIPAVPHKTNRLEKIYHNI